MLNNLQIKSCELPPKTTYYLSDGTGRDSYIKKNNGGLLITPKISKSIIDERTKQFFMSPKSFKIPERFEFKTNKYLSDGSGRDYYVKVNEGGSVINPTSPTVYFENALRNYQRSYPINGLSQYYYMQQQMKPQNLQLSTRQKEISQVLSKPKMILPQIYRKNVPPNIKI